MSPIPVPVPPELRPRGPKSVRGPSPVHPVAAPTDKYSSLSEETDSVAARVKKRLQRVTKKKPSKYLPDASAKALPINRSKSKADLEKTRAARRPILREAWIIEDIVNKKETTRPSSKPSPIITLRAGKPKHEIKELRRRGRTKDLQCDYCDVSVSFENLATLRRHVAEKHRRHARQSYFAPLPSAGGPRTFNGKVSYRCRSDAERILGGRGSRDEALLEFRSYIAGSDHYGAELMDSGFQNMSDVARGTGLVSHATERPFDATSAFRPIASKGGRSIQQMMSGVLMAAKRAHAESPLQPLPGEPEEERVARNMPGMSGMEEEKADSDYSMEGAASGADDTIDEVFANMIEVSLKGKSVDGQISIDEESVLSSSLLVHQDHIKRSQQLTKDASGSDVISTPPNPIASSTPLNPLNSSTDVPADLNSAVANDARLRSVAERVSSKMDKTRTRTRQKYVGATVSGIVPTTSGGRDATSAISLVALPSGSRPSTSDSEADCVGSNRKKKKMTLVDYRKKKAAEAMEEGEVEDSDPECSIVNIKIESVSGGSHRPKARRDDAWERARRRKRRKLAETITVIDSSESGEEEEKEALRKECPLRNDKILGGHGAILKSKSSARSSQKAATDASARPVADDLNVTGSAAATTTDDPDCLRLQDSRVLFSSADGDSASDSDAAPRRRRRSDPEASASTSRSFERIVDSLPENLRANWTWLRQRRLCFRQLEFGHCLYKDKSKKDWLCDKSHTGIEMEDLMRYLDLISNARPEELPNLLRFNGKDRRVERVMAIYNANKPSENAKGHSATSPAFWLKLLLKCIPCVVTAERDAAYIGFIRTFVADLEFIARSRVVAGCETEKGDFAEALQLVASAFDPSLPFPRHVRTDALVVAQRAFDLARRTGLFLKSFEGLIDFALENGSGTLIPFNMLLYVAHLPGVRVAGGVFSKIAIQVCAARRLADVLHAFIPAAMAAMTREDAVEMGERRLNHLVNALACGGPHVTLAASPFLRKVGSWGLPGVHDLPREIPSQFVSTELQTLLADLVENGAWDRVAKYFAEIERGDIVRQTDFCLGFFEVLSEREKNDEVDVAFAKFLCALERGRYVLSPVERRLLATTASSLLVFMVRRLEENDWRGEQGRGALLQTFDSCSNSLGHSPWRMDTLHRHGSPVGLLKAPVPQHEVAAACIRLLAKGQRFQKAAELFVSDCGEALSVGYTPAQLFRMARRLLRALFTAISSSSSNAASSSIATAELCELAIAIYDAHLAAHCLETEASFLTHIEMDEVTRDIFNRIATMAIGVAARPGGNLRLVRDLADAFIARHKRMVTFWPATVRSMVHLFRQLEVGETEAEEYYMIGVDLVVPSVYPEQEEIAAGRDEVRIVAKNWMTVNEMALLVRIALLEIGNVGIISRSEAEYYDRLYREDSAMAAAAVQHIPPICVYFHAESVPPTGFPFLDNAGSSSRMGAMDKMKRVLGNLQPPIKATRTKEGGEDRLKLDPASTIAYLARAN